MRIATFSATLVALTLATAVGADDTRLQEQAISKLAARLPQGWEVVQREQQQFPWGHHFCSSHAGPLGTKVVFAGPKPVAVRWTTTSGEDRLTFVAQEALEIWFMPLGYRDTWFSLLCFSRPIQPVQVYSGNGVRVFVRPAHWLHSVSKFQHEVLAAADAVRWPDSPANNPSLISWDDWAKQLANALASR